MSQKRQILLQNALALLCEAQRRASTLKDDTSDEIKDLMHQVSAQAKTGADTLVVYWHDNKKNLPKNLTVKVDSLLDRFGLVKKAPKKAKPAARKKPATKKAPAIKAAPKKAPANKPAAKKDAPRKAAVPKSVV